MKQIKIKKSTLPKDGRAVKFYPVASDFALFGIFKDGKFNPPESSEFSGMLSSNRAFCPREVLRWEYWINEAGNPEPLAETVMPETGKGNPAKTLSWLMDKMDEIALLHFMKVEVFIDIVQFSIRGGLSSEVLASVQSIGLPFDVEVRNESLFILFFRSKLDDARLNSEAEKEDEEEFYPF